MWYSRVPGKLSLKMLLIKHTVYKIFFKFY
jgi:hypothetical protein